ncbi:uncharacterized protein [Amphiura filiformis]|uniref:uncharacterized protein n=1 Tax=Amphiura filiformis TaxID=82378 RepID=UPI003B20D8D1
MTASCPAFLNEIPVQPTSLPTTWYDSYDGLVLCGALGSGHLNLECVPQLIRIVKPGGPIILDVDSESRDTVDTFKDGKFEADLDELGRKGLWVKEGYELVPDWMFNGPGHQYAYKVV